MLDNGKGGEASLCSSKTGRYIVGILEGSGSRIHVPHGLSYENCVCVDAICGESLYKLDRQSCSIRRQRRPVKGALLLESESHLEG
jgi:hypothetical protein